MTPTDNVKGVDEEPPGPKRSGRTNGSQSQVTSRVTDCGVTGTPDWSSWVVLVVLANEGRKVRDRTKLTSDKTLISPWV